MDLTIVLEQLRRELVHLDAAILSLERLQSKNARRGRPPKALAMLHKPRLTPRMSQRRQVRGEPTGE
jgi:hypothetical protein